MKIYFWKFPLIYFFQIGNSHPSNAAHHQLHLANAARAMPEAYASSWLSRPSPSAYLGIPRSDANSFFVLASSSGICAHPRTPIDSLKCATHGTPRPPDRFVVSQACESRALRPILANLFQAPPQKPQHDSSCTSSRASAKKGKAERQYDHQQLVEAVMKVLKKEVPSARAACIDCPSATRSVQRYLQKILANESLRREDPGATLAAQLKFLEKSERPSKGNIDFNIRRLFNKDELEFFARGLKLYAEMGWPMDYQQIRLMFSEAAAKMHRVDWKWGQPYVCSTSYVADFVRDHPELKAFKMSHIDPIRARKATPQV